MLIMKMCSYLIHSSKIVWTFLRSSKSFSRCFMRVVSLHMLREITLVACTKRSTLVCRWKSSHCRRILCSYQTKAVHAEQTFKNIWSCLGSLYSNKREFLGVVLNHECTSVLFFAVESYGRKYVMRKTSLKIVPNRIVITFCTVSKSMKDR